jgi:hypothetical protein
MAYNTMIKGSFRNGIASHFVLRSPEWWLAFALFGFGYQLAMPGHIFATSSAYDVLARIGDEGAWATVLIGLSSLRFLALVLNGSFRFSRRWTPLVRSATAFVSAGAWFAVSIGLYFGNPHAAGVPVYFSLVVADLTLSVFIARQAGAATRSQGNGR